MLPLYWWQVTSNSGSSICRSWWELSGGGEHEERSWQSIDWVAGWCWIREYPNNEQGSAYRWLSTGCLSTSADSSCPQTSRLSIQGDCLIRLFWLMHVVCKSKCHDRFVSTNFRCNLVFNVCVCVCRMSQTNNSDTHKRLNTFFSLSNHTKLKDIDIELLAACSLLFMLSTNRLPRGYICARLSLAWSTISEGMLTWWNLNTHRHSHTYKQMVYGVSEGTVFFLTLLHAKSLMESWAPIWTGSFLVNNLNNIANTVLYDNR